MDFPSSSPCAGKTPVNFNESLKHEMLLGGGWYFIHTAADSFECFNCPTNAPRLIKEET